MKRNQRMRITPQYIVYAASVPDDEHYPKQKHLTRIGMETVWSLPSGFRPGSPEITVAIIDSGALMTHEDFLKGTFVAGYDFIDSDDDPTDGYGHGTHVAGTIVNWTNSGLGAASVAFGVKIMPVRVISDYGFGEASDALSGMIWAADQGADIINISLGGLAEEGLCDICTYVVEAGSVLVAAAGNFSTDYPFYPAYCEDAIAVTDTDSETDSQNTSVYSGGGGCGCGTIGNVETNGHVGLFGLMILL